MSESLLAAFDVFGRYVHAVNRGTAAEVADCFTDDGVLDLGERSFDGRAAVRDFYQRYIVDGIRPRCRSMRHRTTSMSTAGSGATVHAVCYFDVDALVEQDEAGFWGHDVPADSVARNAGRYEAAIDVGDDVARFARLAIITEWVGVWPRVHVAHASQLDKERA